MSLVHLELVGRPWRPGACASIVAEYLRRIGLDAPPIPCAADGAEVSSSAAYLESFGAAWKLLGDRLALADQPGDVVGADPDGLGGVSHVAVRVDTPRPLFLTALKGAGSVLVERATLRPTIGVWRLVP